MSWYEHSDLEPNSIESQIHTMLFNDLTYRACVSVRNLQGSDLEISAHSPTLAYLLDQGYVLSQVLSIQKLLDDGRGVISVKRLLKDVRKHRKLITREAYVAGDGTPYDYDTHVPVIFLGQGIRPGRYAEPILVNDVAPTLAQILGTANPAGSVGHVLAEILQ